MRRFTQSGDTIIEVLVAISVVSIVLGGAYATANRSLNNIRGAQERVEALKLVEGQLERLKVVSITDESGVFGTSDIYCLDDGNAIVPANNPTRSMGSIPSLDIDDFSKYVSDCQTGASGGVQYNLAIDRQNDAGGNPGALFAVHARWERVGGNGRDEIIINYRLNKSSP